MKKLLLALLILGSAAPLYDTNEVTERSHLDLEVPALAHLYQNRHSCSAFVIEKDIVVTAAHCIEPKGEITLQFADGTSSTATPLYVGDYASAEDVAILKADTRDIKPMHIAAKAPPEEDMCLFAGYASEQHQMILPCIRSGVGPYGYNLMGQARSGDSGGPLFGSDGQVIGIITRSDGDLRATATTYEQLVEALRRAHAK